MDDDGNLLRSILFRQKAHFYGLLIAACPRLKLTCLLHPNVHTAAFCRSSRRRFFLLSVSPEVDHGIFE
jgi:hypothetical protein